MPSVGVDAGGSDAALCDAVDAWRAVRSAPSLLDIIPAPSDELRTRLDAERAAFDATVDLAVAQGLDVDVDLERLVSARSRIDSALVLAWGLDGQALLLDADAARTGIVYQAVGDTIELADGDSLDFDEYNEEVGRLGFALSLRCDKPDDRWRPLVDMTDEVLPFDDVRFAHLDRWSGRARVVIGSLRGEPHPVPTSDPALSFTAVEFSPDGAHLLATGYDDDVARLFVGDVADGYALEPVSPVGEAWSCPAWSPDGLSILVSREVDGAWRLSQLDVESGRVVDVRAVTYPYHDRPCTRYFDRNTVIGIDEHPQTGDPSQWLEPLDDDDRELFVTMPGCTVVHPQRRPFSDEFAVAARCWNHYLDGTYLVDATGGPPRHILSGRNGAVSWSPDGEWFLFVHVDVDTEATEIWISNAEGTVTKRVVEDWAGWPAWLPSDIESSKGFGR